MENIEYKLETSPVYRDSVRQPAIDCELNWTLKDAKQMTGFPFKAICVADYKPFLSTIFQRLTIYSPGLHTDPCFQYINKHETETFSIIKRNHPFYYSGDFFVFDTPDQGFNTIPSIGKASFGQNNDAFRLIYSLKKLKENGLQEIDIDALCYGTLRVIHAIGLLSLPHEYPGAHSVLNSMGLSNRIEREQLLSMLRSIMIHSPLKQVEDFFENKIRIALLSSGVALASTSILTSPTNINLTENCNKNICLLGLGMIAAGTFLSKPLAKGICDFGLPFITSYNPTMPNSYSILRKLEHLKREYPQLSLLVTSHAIDSIVGNDIEEFFRLFPVQDMRKYLVVSSEKRHSKKTLEQLAAQLAFRKLYGSSYLDVTPYLEVGSLILNTAQKGQTKDLKEYIKNSAEKNIKTKFLRNPL